MSMMQRLGEDGNEHGVAREELLELLVGGGVSKVPNVESPALGMSSISLAGFGVEGSVLDSFGDGLDGSLSSVLDSGGDVFNDGGHVG